MCHRYTTLSSERVVLFILAGYFEISCFTKVENGGEGEKVYKLPKVNDIITVSFLLKRKVKLRPARESKNDLTLCLRFGTILAMKPAIFHPKVRETIKEFPEEVRRAIGKAIFDLQRGHSLTMPLSKPMPSVALGTEELRVKDSSGIFRTFYYKKSSRGILIFHAFMKKTQKTPQHEIKVGQRRLKEMLNEEK